MSCSNMYYEEIQNNYSRKNSMPLINGRRTGSNKCCGYCSCDLHPGFLTISLRAQHDCIKKECHHYISKKARKELTSLQSQLYLCGLQIITEV